VHLLEIDGADHDSVDRIEDHVGELLGFLEMGSPAPPPPGIR
jgi:hypothetical protein